MEENVNVNNTEVDSANESDLSNVVDLEGVNPVAKAIVLGVAGLATGGLVARKIIKNHKEKTESGETKKPKKEKKAKEPKGKVHLRMPIYRENPAEKEEKEAE